MRFADAVCGVILVCLMIGGQAAAQANPLIGTWTSTLSPGTPAIIYVTLSVLPNGRLQERLMNREGVAYELFGSYEFDPANGVLQYVFTDYEPKQLCSPLGCQPAPVPPGQLNIKATAQVTFPNPNLMIGKAADGTTMTWARAN